MFKLFPKDRRDWLRVLIFPFQAYVILTAIIYTYFFNIWPRRGVDELNHFGGQLVYGCFICFLVLSFVGLLQRTPKKYLNFSLAALSILEIFLMPNWAQA
jgi:hypothetical protein